ncbi:MAG: 4Fe-4S ferredoxin, partial [Bacteroidetes bacterium]
MKEKKQNLWVGVEQLENDPAYAKAVQDEFVQLPLAEQLKDERALEVKANRRDFLKYLGFGLGAATVAAGCDIPVRKAIPYVQKPDDIVPGVATYYASSFVQGGDYCAVLVKTREGRPIKIEGNDLSPVTKGGTSARAQASVLSLYDTNRFSGPQKKEDGEWVATSWAELDKAVGGKLTANARIRILTNTLLSPAAHRALEEFKQKYPNAEVVTYDPVSASALLQANEACFGQRLVPDYRFDKAETIVSFGADFLGTWISPIEYAAQYAEGRKIKDLKGAKISHHVQVESAMTLTGSNADNRILVKPSETGAAIAALYNAVAKAMGAPTVSTPKVNERAQAALEKLGRELVNRQGRCLVVSGTNNTGEQILVNAINHLLGNYGKTLGFRNASLQRQGIDADVQQLIKDMNAGQVDALFVWGANPAFDLPNAGAFAEAMQKVGLKVSFAGSNDDTTDLCDFVAPAHHYLESWGDAQPKRGHYSLMQPTIRPLFDTRQAEESLLRWAGSPNLPLDAEQPYYEYLRFVWKEDLFPKQSKFVSFQAFWDSALHDGVFEIPDETPDTFDFAGDVIQAAARITKPSNSALEISFFETVNMGAGQYADNPWLQEMPDPVTRCVWGNYLAIPIVFDGKRHFDGDG